MAGSDGSVSVWAPFYHWLGEQSPWLAAAFIVGTLVLANVIVLISRRCRASRISSLTAELAASGSAADQEDAKASDDKASTLSISAKAPKRTPVTIITGFLGSGKTTLVNHILANREGHGLKVVVIENEFGSISIDHKLLKNAKDERGDGVMVLANGCMCCSAGGPGDELERCLAKLVDLLRDGRFDYVVIETSGMADPGPLVATLFSSRMARSRYTLDAVVTVVDAKNILWHLGAEQCAAAAAAAPEAPSTWWPLASRPRTVEAQQQLAAADIILLNKCDLVSPRHLAGVRAVLRKLNACADIKPTTHSDIPCEEILGVSAFDLDTVAHVGLPTPQPAGATADEGGHSHSRPHTHAHDHTDTITSATLFTPHPHATLSVPAVMKWLQHLLRERWASLYRVKGILPVRHPDTGAAAAFVVQGVHAELYGEYVEVGAEGAAEGGSAPPQGGQVGEWLPDTHPPGTDPDTAGVHRHDAGRGRIPCLVLIGRDLDASTVAQLQAGLEACLEVPVEEGGDAGAEAGGLHKRR